MYQETHLTSIRKATLCPRIQLMWFKYCCYFWFVHPEKAFLSKALPLLQQFWVCETSGYLDCLYRAMAAAGLPGFLLMSSEKCGQQADSSAWTGHPHHPSLSKCLSSSSCCWRSHLFCSVQTAWDCQPLRWGGANSCALKCVLQKE